MLFASPFFLNLFYFKIVGLLRRTAGFFFDLVANVEANVSWMSRTKKRLHGLEIPESGRIFANVSANVGEVLRIWLRMWVNVASPTNVVNFASICDKKASADACGCLAAVLSFCVPPGMKKAGNFPAFLSFPLKL